LKNDCNLLLISRFRAQQKRIRDMGNKTIYRNTTFHSDIPILGVEHLRL
jgi:hypothetical protein